MAKTCAPLGKLPAKHTLLMNPHAGTKLTRCPHCNGLTYPRKFAFLLDVTGFGPAIQGKTCKYCARCRLILVQQDELEEELARTLGAVAPRVLGSEYFVLGVVELKTFEAGITGQPQSLEDVLAHVSDIRKYYGMGYHPGGWWPKEEELPLWPAYREQRIPREAGRWWVRGNTEWVFEPAGAGRAGQGRPAL